MKKIILVAISLFSSLESSPTECPLKKPATTPVWITVFVHGAVKAEWLFNSLFKVMSDSVEGSTYEKAVTSVRNDPYFFYNHAMQEVGLKKIDLDRETSSLGARGVAALYDQITALAQKTPTIQYYYTFGWSGLMSSTIRLNESEKLYDELYAEIQKISKDHHISPKIRLIAYSHGGNVCLNLAQIKNRFHDACIRVDEMILIGSPIQPETDYLVADPMFKKVYNFYSPDDLVQPSDLFSSKGSRRTFKSRGSFTVPDKLKQICVKVARYNPRNKNRDLPLPVPLDYKKNAIRKSLMNPGHIELWYLGWTSTMYRQKFPLHPFPMVDFVSFITTQIENAHKMGNNLTVTLHPQQEIMTIKNKGSDDKATVPFIPLNKLALLQEKAKHYKPDEDFYQEYTTRIDEALHFGRRSKNGGVVRIVKEDGRSYKISKAAMCLH